MRLVRLGTSGTTRVDFLDLVEALPPLAAPEPGAPRLALAPSAPNPAGRAAEIRFSLASSAHATLAVYDARGRHVRTLVSGLTSAGSHTARWDVSDGGGRRVPGGVYFVRLAASGGAIVRRVAVVP